MRAIPQSSAALGNEPAKNLYAVCRLTLNRRHTLLTGSRRAHTAATNSLLGFITDGFCHGKAPTPYTVSDPMSRFRGACRYVPRTAALIFAMSILPISIIASKARLAVCPPAAMASVRTRGVICQDTPHLSLHQPQ